MSNIASANDKNGETVSKLSLFLFTSSPVQLKELTVTLLPESCTVGGEFFNNAA
jgi:hypothetical protein